MSKRQLALVRAVQDDPDVASVYSWIGPPAIGNGRLVINLRPFRERHRTAAEIMARLKSTVAEVQGIQLADADPAGAADRRASQLDAIPVHPAGRRPEGALRVHAEADRSSEFAA